MVALADPAVLGRGLLPDTWPYRLRLIDGQRGPSSFRGKDSVAPSEGCRHRSVDRPGARRFSPPCSKTRDLASLRWKRTVNRTGLETQPPYDRVIFCANQSELLTLARSTPTTLWGYFKSAAAGGVRAGDENVEGASMLRRRAAAARPVLRRPRLVRSGVRVLGEFRGASTIRRPELAESAAAGRRPYPSSRDSAGDFSRAFCRSVSFVAASEP